MTLANLKDKLDTLVGTSIGQVYFDQNKYLANSAHEARTYPIVIWCFNMAKFQKDNRTSTIQKVKTIFVTAIIVGFYDMAVEDEDDRLTKWDLLEGYFDTYINLINADASIAIQNIDKIKGQYIPEGGISQNKEIGIMYEGIELRIFCDDSTTAPESIPTPVSAEITDREKNIIYLTFDTSLKSVFPDTNTFIVTANSVAMPVLTIGILTDTISLQITNNFLNGSVVTVSYTKPVLNSLQSLIGNEVASFINLLVTNNIT